MYCFVIAAHYTLLDCVFSPEQLTFYCLDMIAWNDSAVADSDFECRLFLLNSRISENENFKEVSKQFPVRVRVSRTSHFQCSS